MSRKGISPRRLERIEKEIAPLVARGLTQREIADKVGISFAMVHKDCLLLKQTWDDQIPERLESARGELVAKHDEIYKIAMDGYFATKNSRMLDLATKQLECLGRLLGQAGPSINLHAHQHNVAISSEAVSELFRPLDAGAYAEMVAAKTLPPTEAQELPEIEVTPEPDTPDWVSADAPTTVGRSDADEPGAPKNRMLSKPFRG